MKELQELVREFINNYRLRTDPDFLISGVLEELGELSKEVKKSTGYGDHEFAATKGFHEEIGDTLMNLIRLANAGDVDMEEALKATMQKMADRIEWKGHPGSRE
ncbi:MAG: MazG nucleotide pyrophosphohydrolase domain-containing protein [Promethearchaeota archaeon]|jgi:NTP pyrophosphatase (non-canonical NTP hydrolase)